MVFLLFATIFVQLSGKPYLTFVWVQNQTQLLTNYWSPDRQDHPHFSVRCYNIYQNSRALQHPLLQLQWCSCCRLGWTGWHDVYGRLFLGAEAKKDWWYEGNPKIRWTWCHMCIFGGCEFTVCIYIIFMCKCVKTCKSWFRVNKLYTCI